MCVSRRFSCLKPESEAEVSDTGGQVRLQQDVLTLKVPGKTDSDTSSPAGQHLCLYSVMCALCVMCVPVCDGRFVAVLVSRYVFVQVSETSRHRLSDKTEFRPGEDVCLQVVRQRTLRRTWNTG